MLNFQVVHFMSRLLLLLAACCMLRMETFSTGNFSQTRNCTADRKLTMHTRSSIISEQVAKEKNANVHLIMMMLMLLLLFCIVVV